MTPNLETVAQTAELIAGLSPHRQAEALAITVHAIRRDLPRVYGVDDAEAAAFAAEFGHLVMERLVDLLSPERHPGTLVH